MKKLISIFMAIAMIFSLGSISVVAFEDEGEYVTTSLGEESSSCGHGDIEYVSMANNRHYIYCNDCDLVLTVEYCSGLEPATCMTASYCICGRETTPQQGHDYCYVAEDDGYHGAYCGYAGCEYEYEYIPDSYGPHDFASADHAYDVYEDDYYRYHVSTKTCYGCEHSVVDEVVPCLTAYGQTCENIEDCYANAR